MKRKRMMKIAATALSGGMLLGSGNCAPDDYWVELWSGAVVTALDVVVVDVVDDAINPPVVLE